MSDYNRSPIVNPIPTSILLIFSGIILVEALLVFGFGGPLAKTVTTIERLNLVQNYGVPPNLASWMFETGNFSINYISRFIVYPFINLSGLSVVFAAVLLLAFGKMVGEVFSSFSVILIWLLSTFFAAFFILYQQPMSKLW